MSMDEAISYALANIDPKLLTGPVTLKPAAHADPRLGFGGAALRRPAGGQAAGRRGSAGGAQDWPGQMHVFQLCAPVVPEATRSLRQIGDYIRQATS
jgi:hypothetical protein